MVKFIEINLEKKSNAYKQLEKMATQVSASGNVADLVTALNHDMRQIDQFITKPPSLVEIQQQCYEAQEEYNANLLLAKERWQVAQRRYAIGESIVKDLAAKKKKYIERKEEITTHQNMLKEIQDFSTVRFWKELAMAVKEGEAKNNLFNQNAPSKITSCLPELSKLKKQWLAQGGMTTLNIKELMQIQDMINNLITYLEYMIKEVGNNHDIQSKKLIRKLNTNLNVARKYKRQIQAAFEWRLITMQSNMNLHSDDAINALKKNINNIISEVNLLFFGEINDKLQVKQTVKTHINSFKYFLEIYNRNKKYKTKAYQEFIKSKLITDEDKKNILPISIHSGCIVPEALKEYLNQRSSFSLTGIILFWFFKVSDEGSSIFSWLRYKLFGKYNQVALLVNETFRQISNLEMLVDIAQNRNMSINLNYISHNSGFESALEMSKFITEEKQRIKRFRPPSFIVKMFSWIPYFNLNVVDNFFSSWQAQLDDAIHAVDTKCEKISNHIVANLEGIIFESIKKRTFLLPPDIIRNIGVFIKKHGGGVNYLKYKSMISPYNIIQKFDFLHPLEDHKMTRTLNVDAVQSFARLANQYWNKKQAVAANLLVSILLREKFPITKEEHDEYQIQLKCLFGSQKGITYKKLMHEIAMKYIFTTGDNGDEQAYAFLKQFAPKAAKVWEVKRSQEIEEKVMFIHYLFSQPGPEKELSYGRFEINDTVLDYANVPGYIRDIELYTNKGSLGTHGLLEKFNKYVQHYNGSNLNYLHVFLSLGKLGYVDCLRDYSLKRFEYLINSANKGTKLCLSEDENMLLFELMKDKDNIKKLSSIIKAKFTAHKDYLSDFVNTIHDEKTTRAYYTNLYANQLLNQEYDLIKSDILLDVNNDHKASLKTALKNFITKPNLCTPEHLLSPAFVRLVEEHASDRTKERYRLKTLKHLLEFNNANLTRSYLKIIIEFIKGKSLEDALIQSAEGKKQFMNMVQNKALALKDNDWQGNLQYFLEYYIPDSKVDLLHKQRLAWLRKYLSFPEYFNDLDSDERKDFDAKFHDKNIEAPNDSISLKQHFGEFNLHHVVSIINEYFDDFNEAINYDAINLIERYIQTPDIQLQTKYRYLELKLQAFNKTKQILSEIENNNYTQAIQFILKLKNEIRGLESLRNQDYSNHHLLQYKQRVYEMLVKKLKVQLNIRNTLFAHDLLSFFVDKLKLKEEFVGVVRKRINGELTTNREVNINTLSKLFTIQDLKDLVRVHLLKKKHSFFSNTPSKHDTQRLFVAICLCAAIARLHSKILDNIENPDSPRRAQYDFRIEDELKQLVQELENRYKIINGEFEKCIANAIKRHARDLGGIDTFRKKAETAEPQKRLALRTV